MSIPRTAPVCVLLALASCARLPRPFTRRPLPELEMGPGVGLTLYSGGFGIVKERRRLDIRPGRQVLRYDGVAEYIYPESVHFLSLTDPAGVQILEQNYEYDLADAEAILRKYLDRRVDLVLRGSGAAHAQAVGGYLKSYDDRALVLAAPAAGGKVHIIGRDNIRKITCAELPGGLITRPTLVWQVAGRRPGEHLCKVSYMTDGIGWHCNYTAVLNRSHTRLDLSGWVTIRNESGAEYKNARIKLLAGDVHRVSVRAISNECLYGEDLEDIFGEAEDDGFEEKSFAEYHLYTLGRPSTINQNQVKQIELIEPVTNVPVSKYLLCDLTDEDDEHDRPKVMLEFDNTEDHGLGIALPAGAVRVYQRDEADGSLEFIGEDWIEHTPRDETVTACIGRAFDVVCERRSIEHVSGYNQATCTWEVVLRNHKDEAVEVRVRDSFPHNWTVLEQTIDGKPARYKPVDHKTAEWRVRVPARGQATLTYKVRMKWAVDRSDDFDL